MCGTEGSESRILLCRVKMQSKKLGTEDGRHFSQTDLFQSDRTHLNYVLQHILATALHFQVFLVLGRLPYLGILNPYRFKECFMVYADHFVILKYRVLKDRGVCKDSLGKMMFINSDGQLRSILRSYMQCEPLPVADSFSTNQVLMGCLQSSFQFPALLLLTS